MSLMARSACIYLAITGMVLMSQPAFARNGGGAQIDREILILRQDLASLRAEMTQLRALLQAERAISTADRLGSSGSPQTVVQSGSSELTLKGRQSSLVSDRITFTADKIILDAKDIEIRGNVTAKSNRDVVIKGSQIDKN